MSSSSNKVTSTNLTGLLRMYFKHISTTDPMYFFFLYVKTLSTFQPDKHLFFMLMSLLRPCRLTELTAVDGMSEIKSAHTERCERDSDRKSYVTGSFLSTT